MKCPVCQVPMYVVEYKAIELDLCGDCRGIWFDRGELELLLADLDTAELPPAQTDEAPRRCPICRHKMDKVNIGPGRRVLIDTCGNGCGLWFDRDELADLAGHLREDGWQVPPGVQEFLAEMFPAAGGDAED